MSPEINRHLDEAYAHLQEALQLSIDEVNANKNMQRPIGEVWERFLGHFFHTVKVKGKENKVNLLSLVSFTKLLRS